MQARCRQVAGGAGVQLVSYFTTRHDMLNRNATTLDALPAAGFLRQTDLVGVDPVSPEQADANRAKGTGVKRARAGRRGLLPFSDSTLWRKVVAHEFPAPVKLSDRVTAWRVEDVRAWMQALGQAGA